MPTGYLMQSLNSSLWIRNKLARCLGPYQCYQYVRSPSSSFIPLLLLTTNSDTIVPSGWAWNKEDLDAPFCWRIALHPWQALFTKWQTGNVVANPHGHNGALVMDLGGNLLIETTGQLLVRNCFYDIFDRIVRLREQDPSGGVVLIGHPGIGKESYLVFLP